MSILPCSTRRRYEIRCSSSYNLSSSARELLVGQALQVEQRVFFGAIEFVRHDLSVPLATSALILPHGWKLRG